MSFSPVISKARFASQRQKRRSRGHQLTIRPYSTLPTEHSLISKAAYPNIMLSENHI